MANLFKERFLQKEDERSKQNTPTSAPPQVQVKEEVKADGVQETETVKVQADNPYQISDNPIADAFQSRPSGPTYNTGAERQDKAMMNAQAVGNLLALLGDVGGVAAGANVQRRTSKPLEPYMQSIQRRKEQFEKDKQVFDKQDWLFKYNELQRKTATDKADARYDQQIKRQDEAIGRSTERYDEGIEYRNKQWDHKLQREEESDSKWWANWKSADENTKLKYRNDYLEQQQKATQKDFVIKVKIGEKEIGVEEGDAAIYLEEAKKWIEDADESTIVDLKNSIKDNPTSYNEQLVRRYLMNKAANDPYFAAYMKQINKPNGIKTYKEYKIKSLESDPRGIQGVFEDKWSKNEIK